MKLLLYYRDEEITMIPPGGIGGGRKGAEKDWGDGDWDVPVAEPPKALEETEETVNEKFKVEMQRLHMSEENQELLKAALLEVRGELRLRKEKSYKDQGRRLDHGYWLKDNQLLVRGVQDFSEERLVHPSGWLLIKIFHNNSMLLHQGLGEELEETPSSWGYSRLLSIGFHKSRCLTALDRTDGDVGAAVELLMAEGFGIALAERPGVCNGEDSDPEDSAAPGDVVTSEWREPSNKAGEDEDDEGLEWMEQREEEKMALESIYESTFQEKIATKVWELKLELPHLWRHLPGAKEAEQKQKQKAKELKGVCPWFSAGHCKFGRRCRQKHVQPDNSKPTDDRHLRGEEEEKIFTLEIRFPEGNKYPRHPCLAVFSTAHSHFPRHASIKITSRLMEESKAMAKDAAPAVFSMVEVLQDARMLDRLISGPEHRLSLPR